MPKTELGAPDGSCGRVLQFWSAQLRFGHESLPLVKPVQILRYRPSSPALVSFVFTFADSVIFSPGYRMKSVVVSRSLLVTALFCFFGKLGALGASVSLNPTLDAFVTSGPSGNLAGNNYGGAGALAVAAAGLSQGEFQSVLQFNLASAKSSFDSQFGAGLWTIQSVTLQLTATGPNNAIFNSSAAGQFRLSWMQNDGWTEGTGNPSAPTATGITFSTLSNFVSVADEALGTFSYNGATNGAFSYSLNLTPSFSADILSGSALSMRMFAADSAVSYISDSRNFGTASARPLLTITAVPEPGMAALGILFVAGLGCRRWSTRIR